MSESLAARHTEGAQYRQATTVFGMWVFLVTELMLFGALFTLYASYRYFYPEAFLAGSQLLNAGLAAVNTAVLIVSSLFIALAAQAAQASKRGRLTLYLLSAAGLGLLFMVLKGVEYSQHYADRLVPGIAFAYQGAHAPQVQLLLLLYFAMTGVHAIHLLIGIGLVGTVALRLWLRPAAEHSTEVELVGLYWHFVDVIWIFLFPLLYLVGRHA